MQNTFTHQKQHSCKSGTLPRFCIYIKSQGKSSSTIEKSLCQWNLFNSGHLPKEYWQKKTSANINCDYVTHIILARTFEFPRLLKNAGGRIPPEREQARYLPSTNHDAMKKGTIFRLQKGADQAAFSLMSRFLLTVLLQSVSTATCSPKCKFGGRSSILQKDTKFQCHFECSKMKQQ